MVNVRVKIGAYGPTSHFMDRINTSTGLIRLPPIPPHRS